MASFDERLAHYDLDFVTAGSSTVAASRWTIASDNCEPGVELALELDRGAGFDPRANHAGADLVVPRVLVVDAPVIDGVELGDDREVEVAHVGRTLIGAASIRAHLGKGRGELQQLGFHRLDMSGRNARLPLERNHVNDHVRDRSVPRSNVALRQVVRPNGRQQSRRR